MRRGSEVECCTLSRSGMEERERLERRGEEERGVGEVERMGRQGGKTHDRRKNKELQICQSCNGILYSMFSFSLGRKDKVADAHAHTDTHAHAHRQPHP